MALGRLVMKINDIVQEGFWSSVGKGLADIAAPGAVEKYQAAKSSQAINQQTGIVNFQGKQYKWMGQQWGQINPTTGKLIVAPAAIQQQLNILSTRNPIPRTMAQPTAQPTAPPAPTAQPTAPPVNINTIQPATKPGTATPAEQAKLQQKIQAALAAQGK